MDCTRVHVLAVSFYSWELRTYRFKGTAMQATVYGPCISGMRWCICKADPQLSIYPRSGSKVVLIMEYNNREDKELLQVETAFFITYSQTSSFSYPSVPQSKTHLIPWVCWVSKKQQQMLTIFQQMMSSNNLLWRQTWFPQDHGNCWWGKSTTVPYIINGT